VKVSDPHPDDVIWEDDERTLTTGEVERALLWTEPPHTYPSVPRLARRLAQESPMQNARHVIECYRAALAEALEVMALDRDELVAIAEKEHED
jgi:hypothetical protein